MWSVIGDIVARLWRSTRRRLDALTDESIRAIARGVVGDGSRPFSFVLGLTRDHVRALGHELSDELDARLVDAVGDELLRVRIPDMLSQLADDARNILDEWEAAERRGLERAWTDNKE